MTYDEAKKLLNKTIIVSDQKIGLVQTAIDLISPSRNLVRLGGTNWDPHSRSLGWQQIEKVTVLEVLNDGQKQEGQNG